MPLQAPKLELSEWRLRASLGGCGWNRPRLAVTYTAHMKLQPCHKHPGEAFLLTVGAFLLTVELLCLQSLKALIGRTFPL